MNSINKEMIGNYMYVNGFIKWDVSEDWGDVKTGYDQTVIKINIFKQWSRVVQ